MAADTFLEDVFLGSVKEPIPEFTKWGKGRPSKQAIEKRNKEIEQRSEWSKRNLPYLNSILKDETTFTKENGKTLVQFKKRF